MKSLKLMLKTKQFKILSIVLASIVIVGGLALVYASYYRKPAKGFTIDVSGFSNAHEGAGWGGVKSTAGLLRTIDATYRSVDKTLKLFGIQPNVTYNYDGSVAGFNVVSHIRMNGTSNPILSTVDSVGVTYKNRLWLTDERTGGTILQMFFDDSNDPWAGNGSLLIIKPYYFENYAHAVFSDTGIFEARMKPSGANKLVYLSFSGSPWKQTGHSYLIAGRIKLVDDGTNFNVTGLVSTYVDGSRGYETCTHGAGYSFYTVAYIAGRKSPFVTTALWGWNDKSVSNTMCGINLYQYGHLNSVTGFVCDGRSASCPDGYPYFQNSDVNRLYSGMDNTSIHEFSERAIRELLIPFVDSATFN